MRFSAAGVRTTAAGRARVFVSTVIAFIPVCSSQATFRSCGAQSRRSDAALASLDSLGADGQDRLNKRFKRSEEHTSALQSLMRISYAVFCLKKKKLQLKLKKENSIPYSLSVSKTITQPCTITNTELKRTKTQLKQ